MIRRRTLTQGLLASTGLLLASSPSYGILFSGASVGGATSVTTFSIVNFSASNSKCRYRRTLWFAKGDMPSGYVPVITQGATAITAQFDERKTWSDGSLQLCVMSLIDADFTGGINETRTYTVSKQIGSFNNTSSRILSDVTGSHTFNVAFSSVQQFTYYTLDVGSGPPAYNSTTGVLTLPIPGVPGWSTGSVTVANMVGSGSFASLNGTWPIISVTTISGGALVTLQATSGLGAASITSANLDLSTTITRGSGAFTADFNTQSAVATRVHIYHSGPVCTSWQVWGMATDNSGGAPDAHLKTIWYVTAWNNPNGTLNDVEYGAVVAQDWWSITAKDLLVYTATLKDSTLGSPIINTYTGVVHPYKMQWMTVRTNNDDNHARRFWASAIPTLFHKFDKSYARTTGVYPPLHPTYIPNSCVTEGLTAIYVPGSAENHRPGIDDGGGYMGRGLMPQTDCIAWMSQTSSNYRYARTNAFAGLHVPYHYRSNDSRTISSGPQAGTDTANTVISLKLRPLSSGSYDFTAQGMPAAIDAYAKGAAAPIAATYVASLAGPGPVWGPSSDCTHAVAYSYGMYLLEGERHFMEATLDLATNCAHQQFGDQFGGAPQAMYSGQSPFQTLLSIPATQYSGNGGTMPQLNNQRNVGWGAMCCSYADVVCPSADVQSGFVSLYRSQTMAFAAFSIGYMPTSQKNLGIYGFLSSGGLGGFLNPPWMDNFQVMGFATAAIACEDSNALTCLNIVQNMALTPWEGTTEYYRSSDYRDIVVLKTQTPYDPATNDYLSRSQTLEQADVTVTSNVITINTVVASTNNDQFYFIKTDDSFNSVSLPTGFTEGTAYFAVNCSGLTMQVAATSGGSPLSIPNGTYSIARQPSLWSTTPMQTNPYLPTGSGAADNYMCISNAALIIAAKAGASAITPTMLSRAATFNAPLTDPASPSVDLTWPNWNFTT